MTRRFFTQAASVTVCSLTMLALAGPLNPDCYFPKRTGCNEGGFCQPGQRVCELTWTKLTDNGSGRWGPLTQLSLANCGDLKSVLILDCDEDTIPEGFQAVGCNDGEGSCCYTTGYDNEDTNEGVFIQRAEGGPCYDITVATP